MKPFLIDGKDVDFHIYPRFDKVYAEVYYTKSGVEHEFLLISKEFGGWWRKPIKADYLKAKAWCLEQILNMQIANSCLL